MSGIDLSPEALQKRREIAERATPGPWDADSLGNVFSKPQKPFEEWMPVVQLTKDNDRYCPSNDDAAHIAANSPDAVIAMIDEIEYWRGYSEVLEQEKSDYYQWFDKLAEACGLFKDTDPGHPESFQKFIDLFGQLESELDQLEKEADWLARKAAEIIPACEHEMKVASYWREAARNAVEAGND